LTWDLFDLRSGSGNDAPQRRIDGIPMTQFRLTRRAALVAGTATVLAAPRIAGAQAPTIKVGVIHPVTGALAFAGTQCRTGAQMAIADINAAGGIKSAGGAKLEALLGDAQGRAEIAASLVDQMAEAGAAGFTGCFASPLGLAATAAAAKYNIPFSIDSGIVDSITTRGLTNVFRFFPNLTMTIAGAIPALDQINKKAGSPVKSAVIVHEDGEFGTNTAKQQAAMLGSIGIEVKELMPHATPTRDFTNIVLKIKALKPDLVMISNYANEYVLLARTLVQQRVELAGTYSILGGGFNLKFAKEAPTVAEGMMDFNHWVDVRNPKSALFRKRVEDAGGTMTWEVPFGYFAVKLLADAWERAGGADKAKTIEALNTSTFSDHFMPYGPTKFTNGQNSGGQAVALQIQKGDMEVVWPDAVASKPAIFPRARI
jgi:branched-chain amino acid transport system substrate-binding protein